MILPDFILHSRVNARWDYSGIDSIENCRNKEHFKNYPHTVKYVYNSRGFRDAEWPESIEELKNAIWCIGDSFTVGLGSPLKHTWPYLLQQQTGRRCINVSMDGASNMWISRVAQEIIKEIDPVNINIMWSFTNRRELTTDKAFEENWPEFYNNIKAPDWKYYKSSDFDTLPDHIQLEIKHQHNIEVLYSSELRRVYNVAYTTPEEDADDTLFSIRELTGMATNTNIAMTFVPNFISPSLEKYFFSNFEKIGNFFKYSQVDVARDGFHFDILTSQSLVIKFIKSMGSASRVSSVSANESNSSAE